METFAEPIIYKKRVKYFTFSKEDIIKYKAYEHYNELQEMKMTKYKINKKIKELSPYDEIYKKYRYDILEDRYCKNVCNRYYIIEEKIIEKRKNNYCTIL